MLVCLMACRFSYLLLLYCTQLSSRRSYEDLGRAGVARSSNLCVCNPPCYPLFLYCMPPSSTVPRGGSGHDMGMIGTVKVMPGLWLWAVCVSYGIEFFGLQLVSPPVPILSTLQRITNHTKEEASFDFFA